MNDITFRTVSGWLNTLAETEPAMEKVHDLVEAGNGPEAVGNDLCSRWRESAEKLLPIVEALKKGPLMGNVMMEGVAFAAQMHALLPEMNDYICAYTPRPKPAGRPTRSDPDERGG